MLRRHGFTLVEMMIVVLIIGILVSIALPNFLRARENARLRTCVANMKEIQGAIEVWAMETRAAANTPVSSFPTPADLVTLGYLRSLPRCPSNGTYSYIGTNLTNYDIQCSIHGNLTNALTHFNSGFGSRRGLTSLSELASPYKNLKYC